MAGFSFKRALFGYNRDAVDRAVAESRDRLEQAKLESARSESALGEVRSELEYTRFSLVEARKESDARATRVRELEAVVAWLADRVVDRERELRAMRAEGGGGFTAEASEEASDAEEAVTAGLPSPDGLIGDLGVDRRGRVEAAFASQTEATPAAGAGEPAPAEGAGGSAERHDRPAEAAHADGASNGAAAGTEISRLYEGRIALEIGPLNDFSQLAGFEDAAGAIEGASDISVRRFSKGRATLQLVLDHPVDLLRELEERSPFEFKVRDMREDGVVLDVERG